MTQSCLSWVRRGVSVFFEYDTPRVVHIRSKRVGVLSRFVQLCILSYIIGYVIVYQKGYQQFDPVESAVTTKLKGITFTNFTDQELINVPMEWKYLYRRIWDVTDYVVPPTENNAFFVTTNVIITPNQTRSTCPEDPNVHGAKRCHPEEPFGTNCKPGSSLSLGHGVNTGKCTEQGTCEILAWCPVERDRKPMGNKQALLAAAENFTVLIKNHIEFPLYGMRRSNILISSNQSYLSSCLYDNETDPFCPVFRLGTIVSLAGENFSKLAVEGAVVSVGIEWNCDLDHDFMKYCKPVYRFRRLDRADAKIAPGWNFRHSQYFSEDKRTLYKVYGILFVLDVQGRAGKFSFIPFFITFGAGLALLGVATIICDIIILYCMRDKVLYREKKYLNVRGSDAFQVNNSNSESRESIIEDQDQE